MGGKSAPKAPNYAALAEEQAKSSKEVTEQQTWANRADQVTPWGQQSWESTPTVDPATGQTLNRWTQTTSLTPELQAAAEAQMRMQQGRSELGESLTGRMQNEYGSAMNWGGVRPGGEGVAAGHLDSSEKYRQEAEDALYGRWASRAKPEQERASTAARTRLYNMGLKEGDSAYDYEMNKIAQQQADAQQQAAFGATTGAGAEATRMLGMDASAGAQNFGQQMQSSQYQNQLRQQQIAEMMQQRGFSLNEMNALLNGQQVAMPQMPGYNTAAASQGTQNLQAGQMQNQANLDAFNAQQAATQGMMSGVGGMAGSFMGFSDRRLKKDIQLLRRVGGINVYSWTYIWGARAVGVMADEVPWAVLDHPSGFAVVDYSRVWR